ncbi:MAG: MFS transporter [Chitinophagaceae bacterium]|nr:MAG: MFS transporter [Chitinophagaceae bacterium]
MNIISNKKIKEENQGFATVLAFALIPLSGFATDIYIPSMPSMEKVLNVTSLQVQLTLSMFLISYGISQLFIGTVVDSYGRYNIGLVSLFLFAVSCIAIAATQNIYLIYLMRIVQGLTVAGIVVAKRAFFVDVYSGDKLKHYLSIFTIIWSTGPIIAPFIGGYLQKFFGWQSNFYFLAGFAVVILVLELIFSGETHRNPSPFRIKKIAGIYSKMISTTSFSLGLVMLAFAYSMVMLYNMKGSFIIEHEYQMSPIVSGYCSLLLGLAWMIGGFIGKATINRPFYSRMVTNVTAQFIFVILMVIVSIYLSNVFTLLVFAFLIHVGAGYTYNNYFSYSLTRFPENAGIAGGLTGGSVYIFVSLLTYLVIDLFPGKDQLNLSWGYTVFVVASFVLMLLLKRKFGVRSIPAQI